MKCCCLLSEKEQSTKTAKEIGGI